MQGSGRQRERERERVNVNETKFSSTLYLYREIVFGVNFIDDRYLTFSWRQQSIEEWDVSDIRQLWIIRGISGNFKGVKH